MQKHPTLEIPEVKLAVFPIPKTASSSIKFMLYKHVHGIEFNKQIPAKKKGGIHGVFFPTKSFNLIDHARYAEYTRITLIRDPIEHLLSAFDHRVRELKELGEDQIDMDLANKMGVPANPALNVFIRNIEKYRVLSTPIRHHTDPFTRFLGTDLEYYTHVYRFDQMKDMVAKMSEILDDDLQLPHRLKQKKKKSTFDMINKPLQLTLLMYCAGDYALMKGYYSDQKYRDIFLS